MTKFKTRNWSDTEIEPVEVERETEASYWINGSRVNKLSTYYHYHNTWEDARDYLIAKQESSIESAKSKIERAKETLKTLREMETPK